jgi:hypothetical protein
VGHQPAEGGGFELKAFLIGHGFSLGQLQAASFKLKDGWR